MNWLYETGFMRWFWWTGLAILLFWPLSLLLDPSAGTPPAVDLLTAPFVALPYSLVIALIFGAICFVPAACGWWLSLRIVAWTGLSGRLAAGVAGIVTPICALAPLAWFSGMMSGEEPGSFGYQGFAYIFVLGVGPVAVIAGPILAATLTWERFPKP